MPASIPVVELPETLLRSLGAGHPWVYRDHVPRGFEAEPGAWVRVRCGNFTAVALWDPASPLALRIFSRGEVPDEAFVERRVRAAFALRDATGVTARASAYRWIAGEGDRLPGITVDRYAHFAVLTTDGAALERLVPWVVAGLLGSAELHGVVRKLRGASSDDRLELLSGRMPPRDLIVEEHGIRFRADLREGQKTGLFLDQRENRRTVETLSSGRRVLNLFGYTGGFSVYAARGGASRVTTVDIASGAIDAARENFALNGFDPEAHEFSATDVFEFLRACRGRGDKFDLVVCDPPSFARNRAQRDRALKAYVRLHAAALTVTEDGGLYAASSCTTQVGVDAFRDTLAEGARVANASLQIIQDAGHAPDHPVLPAHPEGRYLKFLVARASFDA